MPSKVTITIDTDADAFADGGSEVSRILRKLAGKIDTYGPEYVDGETLRDINGNKCGLVTVSS